MLSFFLDWNFPSDKLRFLCVNIIIFYPLLKTIRHVGV